VRTVTSAKQRAEAAWFWTFFDATRLAVLRALASGPQSVADLCVATGVRQQTLTVHLQRLRSYSLVSGERRGRGWVYRLINVDVTPTRLNFTHALSGATASIAREA
jgi:DNA-binding transcriptional ArsR family regulator